MSKDDLIDIQGTVVAVHSGGLYRVQSDAGHEVLAQLSGRMRRFRISFELPHNQSFGPTTP